MAVKVRQKKQSTGRVTLYLDIYDKGQRRFEYLQLYLTGNREADKQTLQVAEKVRAERELAIASFRYDFDPTKKNIQFYPYAENFIATKEEGNQVIFRKFLLHFQRYAGTSLNFSHLTPTFCSDFYTYLQSQHLKLGTANLYLIKLKTLMNQAVRDGIIPKNPCSGIKLKSAGNLPKFLTLSEIQRLVATPCGNLEVRNAFLFSCATGLRISDAYQLRWKHIQEGRIVLVQEKTQEPVIIPLNRTALAILRGQPTDREVIFQFPHYRTINRTLARWAKAAGIEKHITFHCSRHTFGTLCISSGLDLYTTSKLLGHAKLQTTTIYAKVIDQTKEEAVMKLPTF